MLAREREHGELPSPICPCLTARLGRDLLFSGGHPNQGGAFLWIARAGRLIMLLPMQDCVIRAATEADLVAINDIYNHYVLHSTCTYQEEPEPLAGRRQWFHRHDAAHPVIVAEVAGQVAGWGSLSIYHPRSAYRFTVENSVYVHPQHLRSGLGSRLLADLITRARSLGHRAIIAAIDSEQAGSVALHAKHGFKPAGHLRQVGFKFGRWLDAVYLELLLEAPDA